MEGECLETLLSLDSVLKVEILRAGVRTKKKKKEKNMFCYVESSLEITLWFRFCLRT